MEIKELKAQAYDLIAKREQFLNQIKQIEQRLQQINQAISQEFRKDLEKEEVKTKKKKSN